LMLIACVQEDTVKAADEADAYVEHPLLDRVRECSTKPDEAANFFCQILHPFPTWQISLEVQSHPYLAETYEEMEAYCASTPLPAFTFEGWQSSKPSLLSTLKL